MNISLSDHAQQSSVISVLLTEKATMCDISWAPYGSETRTLMCDQNTSIDDVNLELLEFLFDQVWGLQAIPYSLCPSIPHWGQHLVKQFQLGHNFNSVRIKDVCVTSRAIRAFLTSAEHGASDGVEFIFHIDHAINPFRSMDNILTDLGYQ